MLDSAFYTVQFTRERFFTFPSLNTPITYFDHDSVPNQLGGSCTALLPSAGGRLQYERKLFLANVPFLFPPKCEKTRSLRFQGVWKSKIGVTDS